MKNKIAVIEDDRDISELIAYNLQQEGYKVIRSLDGSEGLFLIQKENPDLILLDLMLPGMDGLEICQTLRATDATRDIPIIMVTAKGDESDIVVGLKMGADDYICKPFSIKVLLARIKAVLRRGKPARHSPASLRNFGDLVIDLVKYKILIHGEPVMFTAIEFSIIEFLSRSPGRVYTRNQILDNVWQEGKFIIDRTVDVHVRALRQKLGRAADYIETVRGVGYRFREENS